jgi:formyltetrahydrofolate synthetase
VTGGPSTQAFGYKDVTEIEQRIRVKLSAEKFRNIDYKTIKDRINAALLGAPVQAVHRHGNRSYTLYTKDAEGMKRMWKDQAWATSIFNGAEVFRTALPIIVHNVEVKRAPRRC